MPALFGIQRDGLLGSQSVGPCLQSFFNSAAPSTSETISHEQRVESEEFVETNTEHVVTSCNLAESIIIAAVQSLSSEQFGSTAEHIAKLLALIETTPSLPEDMAQLKGIDLHGKIASIISWSQSANDAA